MSKIVDKLKTNVITIGEILDSAKNNKNEWRLKDIENRYEFVKNIFKKCFIWQATDISQYSRPRK